MIRLLYVSTARRRIGAEELAGILDTSRSNNDAAGVTGLLMVGERRFLQALEGPEGAVGRTFERIERDERHFAVVILSRTEITERAFDGWAMAAHRATGSGDDLPAPLATRIAAIGDADVQGYFSGFAQAQAASPGFSTANR